MSLSEVCCTDGFGENRLGVTSGSAGFGAVEAAPKRPPKGLFSAGLLKVRSAAGLGGIPNRDPEGLFSAGFSELSSVAVFGANILLAEACSRALLDGAGFVAPLAPKMFLNGCDVAVIGAVSFVAALGAKGLNVVVCSADFGANILLGADGSAGFAEKMLWDATGAAFAFAGSEEAGLNMKGLLEVGAGVVALGAKRLFVVGFSGTDGVEAAGGAPKRDPKACA